MDWLVCILASPGRGCLSRISKPSRPQIIIKYRKKKKRLLHTLSSRTVLIIE